LEDQSLSKTEETIAAQLNFQALAKEVSEIPGVLSCTIINSDGAIKGRIIGYVPHSDEVLDKAGKIGSAIWGGLKILEPEAGPLNAVIVSYEKFRVYGVPIPGTRICVMAAVKLSVDPFEFCNRIAYFVQYFMGNK